MAGLAASLFVPRRRLWLRLTPASDGRTVIAAAALARGDDPGLRADLDRVLAAVRGGVAPSGPVPVDVAPIAAADGPRPARPTDSLEDT